MRLENRESLFLKNWLLIEKQIKDECYLFERNDLKLNKLILMTLQSMMFHMKPILYIKIIDKHI